MAMERTVQHQDLSVEGMSLTLPTEKETDDRLVGNTDARKVWDATRPLLDGGPLSRRFWGMVPASSLLRVPDEVLPEDIQGTDHELYLLADGATPSGAYKFRGVMSALLRLEQAGELPDEIVVGSTGNHAAATAIGAILLGRQAVVYMPENAVGAKIENTLQYGAEIRFVPTLAHAVLKAEIHGQRSNAVFIHPYDDPSVIAGQGTASAWLPNQLAQAGVDPRCSVDRSEPVGGAGNIKGNAVTGRVLLPNSHTHAVQAEDADVLIARLEGRPFDPEKFNPAVDGAAVINPGSYADSIVSSSDFVHGQHVASRGEIAEAMAVTARFTELYEPAGAMALAAAMGAARRDPTGKSIQIAHSTGINTTQEKVYAFAEEAYRNGNLSGKEAFDLISRASIDARRRPNSLELEALRLAAAARQSGKIAVRHRCKVTATR
jgi:threonine dehydratase